MARYRTLFLALLIPAACLTAGVRAEPGCKLFVLKASDEGVTLESVDLAEDEVKVFSTGGKERIIAPVLPVGPGKSGDLVQTAGGPRELSVQCRDGALQIRVRRPDRREQAFPAVTMDELANYDIRVNVTAADGSKIAFLIREYAHADIDDGPVIDIFGGKIPMQPGDYAITTETDVHETVQAVAGVVPVEFAGGLFIVRGRLAGGPEGYFVVDFGAGATVFSKDFLPAGTELQALRGVEYSGEGRRTVKGIMEGAGGAVDHFLGNAEVGQFHVGPLVFSDLSVHVVDGLFTIEERPIAGIIGLDLLRRAGVVHFGTGLTAMTFSDRAVAAGKKIISVPFSVATDHIFIDGKIRNVPLSFIFDTGARASLLSASAAASAGLEAGKGQARQFRGLDGNPIEAHPVTAGSVTLGKQTFSEVTFHVSDLYVLNALGLQSDGGILGNDFLSRFAAVEIDFSEKVIRLLP
jgi:hypothetical protein